MCIFKKRYSMNFKIFLLLSVSLITSSLVVETILQTSAHAAATSSIEAQDASSRTRIAFKHFGEDRELIVECLKHTKAAELQFFWTTGRTLSDNPAYSGSTHVDVGGATYGEKFFPYVSKLLEVSPEHLTVKFICDTMTEESNKSAIGELKMRYGDRFDILSIGIVHAQLLRAFPEKSNQLNTIFKNATGGNPAISSDIYRLLMPFARDCDVDTILRTQYTYCDVDTFCFGMEESIQNGGHSNLIKALFAPSTYPSVFNYIGMKKVDSNCNDLIKMTLVSDETYRWFCLDVLSSAGYNRGKGKPALLKHFTILHDIIKRCEDPESCEAAFQNYLKAFEASRIVFEDIIYTTGPGFTSHLQQMSALENTYPRVDSFGWHGTQLILYGSNPITPIFTINNRERNPYYSAGENGLWGGAESTIVQAFRDYENSLFAALFAKSFGEKHPFNQKLRQHLVHTFPYACDAFKEVIKKEYDWQKQHNWIRIKHKQIGHGRYVPTLFQWNNKVQDYVETTHEEWLDLMHQKITTRPDYDDGDGDITEKSPYYFRLTHLLGKLGVEILFIPEHLDFRRT